ncbi:DUF3231 family protein [Alkalihalobacillus oceani]|uniref:DUF3231 family protein n=1 Tax=Halalkalibacter oceani TaxID=1653776 RepID=UPI00203E3CD8|nr:DUF3231 family protein [Halalkalibacter oceani]MCM3760996.1 DUF3231 family protein [Halalkalibacter oceani]
MPIHAVEALTKVLHSLHDDESKPPLHVGEVMTLWTYLALLEEAIVLEQIYLNTTEDTELEELLKKIQNKCNDQVTKLKEFLQQEGVPFPPAAEQKPYSEARAIPVGAKMSDSEIASAISAKMAALITLCATGISQAIRNDVSMMLLKFQIEAVNISAILKSSMKKRGWLKVPPAYSPPGSPVE